MTTRLPERRLVRVSLALVAAHAADIAILGASPGGAFASNLIQTGVAAVAAWAAGRARSRAEGLTRRLWTLLCVNSWMWCVAQVTWTAYEWFQLPVGDPSWPALLFRLALAPSLMALLLDEEDGPWGVDWERVLDFAQVGILYLFFYYELYLAAGAPEARSFSALADLQSPLLAAGALVRSRFAVRTAPRTVLGRLTLFLVAYALASNLYIYAQLTSGTRTGHWPDLLWSSTFALAAALAAGWQPPAAEPGLAGRPGRTLPNLVPAAIPLVVLGMGVQLATREPTVAFLAVVGSVMCYGVRLLIAQYRQWLALGAQEASEERYRHLIELSPDAIFIHAAERVLFANPAASTLLGASSAEALRGRSVPELVAFDAGAERLEAQLVRLDGETRRVDAVSTDLEDGEPWGGPGARLTLVRDVTPRRRAQEERDTLRRTLEARNAELERFSYSVSHDLMGPLITIKGFLDPIVKDARSGNEGRLQADLARVRGATRRLQNLLARLLDLSRIGRVASPPVAVPLAELLGEALRLVEGGLAARGIRVEVGSDLPVVRVDRARLVEALHELLGNAVKFMGDQPHPRIRVDARVGAGETLVFVEDNGIGIDPRYRERVFGLFDKLDPSSEGTGAGLAVVKRIVETHGGRVWAESAEEGPGSRFCFALP